MSLKNRVLWLGAWCKQTGQACQRSLRRGASPDLLIVGAQKAGTTSLFNHLAADPGFSGSQRKEVHFFDRDERYQKGLGWYERFFDRSGEPAIRFEATPNYLSHPEAPARIHAAYPDVRIVIVLREPVARAYSAWNMFYGRALRGEVTLASRRKWKQSKSPMYELFCRGRPPTFREYIDQEFAAMALDPPSDEPAIIRTGIYWQQIARYLDVFSEDQLLILGFHDVVDSPPNAVARVRSFVGFDPKDLGTESSNRVIRDENRGRYSGGCPEDLRIRLEKLYQPHNAKLFELLGARPNW